MEKEPFEQFNIGGYNNGGIFNNSINEFFWFKIYFI